MCRKPWRDRAAAAALWSLLACAPTPAADLFEKADRMIPMRDGVKLHTVVFTPKDRPAALPILFVRTPYGVAADERAATGGYEFLIEDGYILVFQDIRGRFKSEGEFVMQRPPRTRQDRGAIDESTDAYDTIDWMLEERAGQQRPRRHAGRQSTPAGWSRHGAARPAPGAQGGVAAGFARRHVPRRRLPPQRRVPPELRLRIRRA